MSRTTHDVKNVLNERFQSLFHHNADGTFEPFVCICCDKLLKNREICYVTEKALRKSKKMLTPSGYNSVRNENLVNEYKFPQGKKGYKAFMKTMMLSPRASYKRTSSSIDGYTCCQVCKTAINKAFRPPFYAIVNNNYKGQTPQCLLDLTREELAFLTPVKTRGYCFTYMGGKSMNMKGTLAYYRVDESKTCEDNVLTELS